MQGFCFERRWKWIGNRLNSRNPVSSRNPNTLQKPLHFLSGRFQFV
ncbi:hypothetical protein LEP1GSC061_1657 [Leptospira wolffii serovar Khorat str. Khorat-H2]|nr:hypothetical protein LEP1GSC061_1657 [Leptospira wolffii serovar Khorat str. Khorat-H2]